GNAANGLLSGLNGSGHDEGTTHAAIGAGTITIRDKNNQTQDVAGLDRDTAHANGSIDPIFDKEKEQDRIREAQLISEIGSQGMDIASTQGKIEGLNAAKVELAKKGEHEPDANTGKAEWDKYNQDLAATDAYKTAEAKWGTGSDIQRGIQAVTAGIQGLAGGNIADAIAGAAAPELANIIGHHADLENDPAAKAVAHAVLGGIVAELNGGSAAAGAAGAASGELAATAIANAMYPNTKPGDLSQSQKDTVTTLATIAAGMAGGIAGGGTSGAISGAQAGKNSVENNWADSPSTDEQVRKLSGQYSKALDGC
ncbi:TPA: VENN motif pre-toxin domain-containing protein, partial [Klebsiella aerogenes]|nr:VENN motif pre-toxin domain-containing protein [Klebsiella aerogenes]HCM1812480.1 VENN motif pre-toxin domain-containing protein [Klebsiella aerogenes]